jgi:hypothetical protein
MANRKVLNMKCSGFSGTRQYVEYVECLKNHDSAVDRTFYDAIKVDYCIFSITQRTFLNIAKLLG